MRIAVFSTYDVTPSQNGGEIRFLNLYRRLSRTDEVRILSYDLRCKLPIERTRQEPNLDIINAAVSEGDFDRFFVAREELGMFPHDVLCIASYDFSVPFLTQLRKTLEWADIVVVTTPFLIPLVFSRCGPLHLKVYEAHNIEGRAKANYLARSRVPTAGERFTADTLRAESLAVETADIVIAVSEQDAEGFVADYGVSRAKIQIVANGVVVASYDSIPAAAKQAFRKMSGLADQDVGVFLGSAYGPNVTSYRMARQWLQEAGFRGSILVIGSIVDAYDASWGPVGFTEHWLGFVDDVVKRLMLSAADFALQIVTSGGGTNLKLFDYMAAGVPILANAFGARGVTDAESWFVPVDSADAMLGVVSSRQWRSEHAAAAARVAHDIALRDFDWERIAERYRAILA